MDSGVENAPPASLGPGYLSWRIEDLIARTKSLYGILSSHKNSKASEAKQLLASIRNLFGVLHALSLTVSSFDDGDSADTSSDVPCLVQCHQDLASFEALLADRDGSTGVGSDWPVLATRMRVRLEQHIAQLKLASYAESRWRFFKCMTAAALPELSTGRQPLAAEDQSNDADPTLDTSTQPPPITPSEGAVPEWPPTFSTPELLRSRLLLSDATDVGASLKRFPDILRWLPGTVSTSSSTQPFCSPALRPDNESILLTGAAACGKSVFVAGLLRLLRERAAEDVYRHVILYHLIDYRSKLPRTHTDHREQAHPKSICLTDPAVGRMLEDFVNQLTEQLPEDLERLDDPKTRIWDAVEKSKYSDDVREGNYEPILNLIIEALGCIDCVYVLLDGLDELEYGCGPNEQKGHQDALLKTLEALKRQPGVRMRILVAVRPNIAGRVEPFITPCTKVEYSPSRDELAQFARRRLGEMRLHSRTAPPVSPELRETMAAMLADRAAGNFRLAEYTLEYLLSRSTDADRLRALEHAYHSLDKLYRDQIKTLSRVGKGSSIFDLAFLVASCTGRDFPAISLDEIVHAAWLLDSTYTSSTKLTNLNGGLFPLVDLFLRKRIFKRGAYGPRVTVVEFTHFTVLELLDDALEALTTNGTYWRQTKALATSAARERAVMSHLTEASLRLLNAPDFNIPLGDAVTELRALRSRTEQLPLYAFAVQSGLRTARSVLSLNSGWDEDNATKFNHENIEREVERLLCDPVQRNNLISWLFAHAVSERHMLGMLSASQFKQSYDDMFYVRLIERLAKLPSPSVHVAAALGFLRQLRSILYPGLLSFWRESSSLLLNTISPIFGHPLHAAVLGVRCLQYDGIAVAVMVEGANACSQLHSQLPDASDTGFLPQSRKTEAHARSTSPFAGALCFQSIGQEDYSAAGRTLGALLVSGANASLADDEMSRFAKLSCQRHSEHDATLVGTDGIRRECPGCSSPPIDMRTLALGVGYMSGNVEVVVKMIQSHARGSPSGRMEPLSGSFFSALSAIAADGDLSDAIKGGSTTPGDSSDLSRGEFLQGVCLEILAWAVCKLVSPGSEHEDDDEMEELGDDELEPVCADMFAQVYAFMVKHRLPAIDDIQLGWKHRSSDFCIPGVSDRYLRRVFLTYWNAMPDSDEYYAVLYYLGRDGRYDANMKPPKRKAERTSNQTMLFLAAETGATATALALVETGADVNQRDAHGRTPIMFVENATMLHRLLDLGADIEARDDEGRTLWHVVAATNDENLAGHLVAIYSMPDGNGTQRGDGAPNVVGSSGRSARFTASAAVAALEVRAINGRTPLCEALCNPQRGRGSFGEREADDEIEDEVYSTPSAASILLTYCDTPECFERGYDDILMLGEMAVAWFPRRRREPQPAKALLLLLSELVERASIAGVPDTEAAILGSSTSEARRLYERFCKNAG